MERSDTFLQDCTLEKRVVVCHKCILLYRCTCQRNADGPSGAGLTTGITEVFVC